MPTIAIINGIAVIFYPDDHDPPHLHLRSANFRAKMAIGDFSVFQVRGRLSPADLHRVKDWARRHQPELFENWLRARRQQPLLRIED